MISVNDRLTEAFATLPVMDLNPTGRPEGYRPVYDWGNSEQLIRRAKLSNLDMYPLIYQTSTESTQLSNERIVETDLTLILAVQNLSAEDLNSVRWATTYRNILYPLAKNIETLFTKGGIFIWDGEYTLEEFPNYGNNNQTENETIDIWDALSFRTTIKIYGSQVCMKPLKYT